MTIWFNDLSMQDAVHKQRQRGLELDVETREAVMRRARYLDRPDDTLMRLALEGNLSYRVMSQIIGRKSAGATFRRVRSLLRRLREPVVVALLDRPGELSAMHCEIGIRRFVKKQTLEQIERETGVSRWEISHISAFVWGWAKGTQRARPDREAGPEERAPVARSRSWCTGA
jgi:hypothetical protein